MDILIKKIFSSIDNVINTLVTIPTHEHRIKSLEDRLAIIETDHLKMMQWLEDHENRIALLEHFNGYTLDNEKCLACNFPMRIKRNTHDGTFFLGCVNYRANPSIGKGECPGQPISNFHLEKLLRKKMGVA